MAYVKLSFNDVLISMKKDHGEKIMFSRQKWIDSDEKPRRIWIIEDGPIVVEKTVKDENDDIRAISREKWEPTQEDIMAEDYVICN